MKFPKEKKVLLNKQEIINLGYDYIEKENLSNYIDSIIFKHYVLVKKSGEYSIKYKQISLKKNLNNFDLFYMLFHELTHVYQHKIMYDKDDSILKNLYKQINNLVLDNYNFYLKYHDLIPLEHHAICNSLSIVLNYVDYNDNDKALVMSNYLLKDYLLKKELYSPIELLNKLINKKNLDYCINYEKLLSLLSNYDKLIHGLPIDIELYKYLKDISDKKNTINDYQQFTKVLKTK